MLLSGISGTSQDPEGRLLNSGLVKSEVISVSALQLSVKSMYVMSMYFKYC